MKFGFIDLKGTSRKNFSVTDENEENFITFHKIDFCSS